jgi:hypothetical protein
LPPVCVETNLKPQPMSYLHCPTCKCAYNIALSALCPNCPVAVSDVDPAEDIVSAVERLADAMARATPTQRRAATSRMDRLALPAPGAKPVPFHDAMLRTIRDAIDPTPLHTRPAMPPPPAKPQPLLASIAFAVVERIADRINEHAPQLMDKLPSRLRRAGSFVRARMRALAA